MLDTIKSNKEISELFSSGLRKSNRYASFLYIEKGRLTKPSYKHDQYGRVAFIAGKKNGNAVWRNSAKRRLREIYRANIDKAEKIDLLLIAKPSIMKDSFHEVLQTCTKTFKEINDGR